MNRDLEFERMRHENLLQRQALAVKEEQMRLLKQENSSLQQALKETFLAVKQARDQVTTLTERVKTLEEQQAKDSHNSHLPPSSDRFGRRKQKSLRLPSGKKPGGQAGHQGHHLQPMVQVDEVIRDQFSGGSEWLRTLLVRLFGGKAVFSPAWKRDFSTSKRCFQGCLMSSGRGGASEKGREAHAPSP